MFSKLFAALAWTSLVFIAYATLSPIGDRPHSYTSAHLEHLGAFAFLGVAFSIAYPRRTVLVWSAVLGSAVLLEYLQTFTPDRHGTLIDAGEKVIGASLGLFAGKAALLWRQRRTVSNSNDW